MSALPARPATSTSYRPELDAFRVLPVLMVIAQHWLPVPWVRTATSSVGVTTFFVLSGYFVTNILRRAQASAQPWRVLKPFYLRRSLRILPAFYAALLAAWLLNLSFVREYLGWFALQGANFLFFSKQAWGEGVGHWWSLAVEEQFYLLWPALVLLVGVRRLPWLLGALVVLGPVLRWYLLAATGTSFSLVLLPAHLDVFALGGLLGLAMAGPQPFGFRSWAIGFAILLPAYVLLKHLGGHPELVLAPSLLALLAACALGMILLTPSTAARKVLSHPVLVWVGQRSYGLYLYHLFMPVLLHRVLHRVAPAYATAAWEQSPLALLLMAAGLLIVASVSWSWLERPLRRLGQRFAYPRG
ncbi:acyltransferase family protein [Hymenobacter latericus]|uniref:acyltransferase family protein n=1 Tax=Hymenobacter sp. YIM 151858-1 TaxID=2987688 RepID=UPI002226D8EE|nr:acyltransferase [Hymenobacter sp. YIM 151858-1]UYZ59995.1 acyltransferase [Hymenobacter sp. YIM 151858-1]